MSSHPNESSIWSGIPGPTKSIGFVRYDNLGNYSDTHRLQELLLELSLPQSGKYDRCDAQGYSRRSPWESEDPDN
jgi:hypothetical protein